MNLVRRATRAGLAAVAAMVLLAALAPASAFAGASTTRWVDDDGHAGPNKCKGPATAATSIQDAVDASGAGGTILVCPGTYREQVMVNGPHDGLTIRGVKPWQAVLRTPTATGTAGDFAMLTIQGADDVTIRGLKLATANEPSCVSVTSGILIQDALRASIRGNQLYGPPEVQGCNFSEGIAIQGTVVTSGAPAGAVTATAFIGHNLVSNFYHYGIRADGNVVAEIADNALHYYVTTFASSSAQSPSGFKDASGILVGGSAVASVSLNVVQSAPGAAVGPVGGPQPRTLSNGISLIENNGPTTVRGNLVRRVFTGLYVQAINARILDNVVRRTDYALFTGDGGGGNLFRGNHLRGISYGIYSDSGTSGNTFRNNTVHASEGTACRDFSTGGSGDFNTNNTWTGNTGNSDNPDGICPPAH